MMYELCVYVFIFFMFYFCRLQKVLGLDSLNEVLDVKIVNSKHIFQNAYNVNKQGIVILEDKSSEYFRSFHLTF